MISVLVLTFNEEINIQRCLDSVNWSDDVVVVDSFSTDHTATLARSAGSRVLQNHFVNFSEQRNFGLIHGGFKHDWVLHLDADEVVTPELRGEMLTVIKTGEHLAYRIASKVIFEGRWLRHSSMYPCYQVRLGKRNSFHFVQVGHGQRENLPTCEIATLKQPLLHYSFSKGLEEWFAKHNRYSSAEAVENLKTLTQGKMPWVAFLSTNATSRWRALKELSIRLPLRPFLRFLYVYFWRLGFLDGEAGWRYCQMLSIYECMIVLKLKELQARNSDLHSLGSGKNNI